MPTDALWLMDLHPFEHLFQILFAFREDSVPILHRQLFYDQIESAGHIPHIYNAGWICTFRPCAHRGNRMTDTFFIHNAV